MLVNFALLIVFIYRLNSYLKCAFCAFSLGKKRFTSRIPSDTIVPAAFGRGSGENAEKQERAAHPGGPHGDRAAAQGLPAAAGNRQGLGVAPSTVAREIKRNGVSSSPSFLSVETRNICLRRGVLEEGRVRQGLPDAVPDVPDVDVQQGSARISSRTSARGSRSRRSRATAATGATEWGAATNTGSTTAGWPTSSRKSGKSSRGRASTSRPRSSRR